MGEQCLSCGSKLIKCGGAGKQCGVCGSHDLGPVQGGGDTELVCEHKTVRRMCDICSAKPEPDVLERLRARVVHLGLVIPNAVGDKRQSLEELHAEVADAIAEIECARGENRDLEWRMMSLEAQLREYTEAKPVAYGVFSDGKLHDMVHDSRFDAELWVVSQYGGDTPGVSIRALAVVAPKGDTEE